MKLTIHWVALLGLGALAGCSGSSGGAQTEVTGATSSADSTNTTGGFMSFGGQIGLNLCLDASGGTLTPLERIDSWYCNGTAAQQWTMNLNGTITPNAAPYLCLDVYDNDVSQGIVDLNYCSGSPGQVWLQRNGTLLSGIGPGSYCLDVLDGSTDNNATVHLASCNGTAAQIWWPFGFGVTVQSFQIWGNCDSRCENECLDVLDNNPDPGSTMDDWPCNNLTNQTFMFTQNHQIMFDGLCLDVLDANVSMGQVHMQDCNGTDAQAWDFVRGSNGDITIQSQLWDGFTPTCLDIYGDHNTPGTTVDLADCNGTMAQAWYPYVAIPDP
jgi:Ricin-type beta-trefoil lectin domain